MSDAGDMTQPAAWLAVAADGSESSAVYLLREQAEAAASEWGWFVVPLYRSPALTDAEREALAVASIELQCLTMSETNHSAALRGLLARLG